MATEEIRKEAKQIVQKCGFKDYRETSAKHGFEVDAVFEAITSLVTSPLFNYIHTCT